MERSREQILAANEAVAREVNEGIERGHWPGEEDRPAAYKCECSRIDCNRLIELTPAEYETVRGHPRCFLVAPGHEDPQIETVVNRTPKYLVVEKRGAAGAVAEDADPRG